MNDHLQTNQQVGVWIDHTEAFVVFNHEPAKEDEVIVSNIEKHVRYSGHAMAGSGDGEDTRERHFEKMLNNYYDEVITHLNNAASIFIFGPGEAKGEFKKRLERTGPNIQIVGFEVADKLTDNQIVAKVHLFFARRL